VTNGGVESCDGIDNDCLGDVDEEGCPATCRGLSDGSNGYMLCDAEVAQSTAASQCAAQGLALATVESEAENAFLSDTMFPSDGSRDTQWYWIGGTEDAVNGWVWPDGSSIDLLAPMWFTGEPSGGARDCLEVDDTNRWRAVQCSQGKRYVCESDD
jgi:hypothetical protein